MFVGGRCSCGNNGKNETRRVDLTIIHDCIKRYTQKKIKYAKARAGEIQEKTNRIVMIQNLRHSCIFSIMTDIQ